MKLPRIMLAAASSGSGKTLITCGLLQLLKDRGCDLCAFKCGPDYIDPMFHSKVLGLKSRNLDSFFTKPDVLRGLMAKNAKEADIAVVEGVMGYYDGLSGFSPKASAYDAADITDTPVIFIVNCRGMSLSVIPYIKGFLEYKENSHIKGVILNQLSPMLYKKMKEKIEGELPVKVLGYVPKVDFTLESRHLGLVMPDEIEDLKGQLSGLADVLSKTLEVDEIIKLAKSAPALDGNEEIISGFSSWSGLESARQEPLKIGLAKDEAFCFFYEDNLQLLRDMGAELIEFSPVHDSHLPENVSGLLLYGGYPELLAKELSENTSMKGEIKAAINAGLPVMAECGGFMYLHESMQGADGNYYPMAGVIEGTVHKRNKLTRFGYITLSEGKAFGKEVGSLPSHEFHYYDSENCGDAFFAQKPLSERNWRCIHSTDTMLAGYPHMYYCGNENLARAYMEAVLKYKRSKSEEGK